MPKTIIISNRLPVTVKKEQDKFTFQKSVGGLATGLSSVAAESESIWLGWPGGPFKDTEQDEVRQQLLARHMCPVFLSDDDISGFYEGFSNSVIWPNFHYFNEHVRINQDHWTSYKAVNELFCRELKKIYEPGDRIWVHDYHLLLLPGMIRREFPGCRTGFFLHIPFPSFEVFRILPWREELLSGMLGADLIGFHTYDDVGHFSDCITRLLGPESVMGEIRWQDRIVALDAFPIGIDYERYAGSSQQKPVRTEIEKLRNAFNGKRLVLSVDRLDYSKGIRERLRAIDLFFGRYPEYREKVSVLFVMVPSRDQVKQYKNLKDEIDELVGKINGKYSVLGWLPIHYLYKQQPFKSLSAMYTACDVAMVTPLRDGMNLVCKEYIASRSDQSGALILSERAGAARTLTDAIRVNPDNIYQMADALHTALSMPAEEQRTRIGRMQTLLKKYDIFHWAELFMKRLDYIKNKQLEFCTRYDTGRLYREILPAYQQASKRLLLLDYDGTLVGFTNDPADARTDQQLLDLIGALVEDESNTVFIITGRDRHIISEWFSDPRINIIAEHGVWARKAGQWTQLLDPEADWKDQIRPILELFIDRTPGSLLEPKEYSLAWHYRNADKDLGNLRARELTATLNYYIHNLNVQALQGNKVIEVKSSLINKGYAVKSLLAASSSDFILSVGDDTTDEDMFRTVPDDAFSIKVGDAQTQARFKLHSWKNVRALLEYITQAGKTPLEVAVNAETKSA